MQINPSSGTNKIDIGEESGGKELEMIAVSRKPSGNCHAIQV